MTSGIELATEWVTLLPETATLAKKIKEFKPPDIHVKLVIDKDGKGASSVVDNKAVVKQAEKTGKEAGKALVDGVEKEVKSSPLPSVVDPKKVQAPAKKAGEVIAREVLKPIQKVDKQIEAAIAPKDGGRIRQAAQRMGDILKAAVSKSADEAGTEAGKKLAASIEKAKGAITKAERSLADARAAAANIESRIAQSEARVQQLRKQSADGLKNVAAAEKNYNNMRADSANHTADEIAGAERQMIASQKAQESRDARLQAAQLSRGRLDNSQAQSANRVANAVDGLGAREAALATTMGMLNDPLEEGNRKLKGGGVAAGGMMASLVPLGRQLLVTSGLFTGALGLAGGIQYTLKTGNEFTDTINRMQGVLGRTSGEMGDITTKARELGKDFTLPATSANDAATAMFELTKAGFSAQDAMDAAKGSLQLSAAAGIDAASAATITGTSLNAFGLQATDAAKVTDLLANAANLFPGEMTDFGYSLSQSGAVAKSFGIDIEDTTTALGFLAKAGIKSSDAGTLIKTMLLSLTDQSKPAQGAIKDLGLELYNQDGTFKGLEYVYKRLGEASKSMTDEQYQAATATLFGTDAARFAGIAAGDAAPNWDDFRSKIEKTGTAAEVANARMQGLPGAMERLKNAGGELALVIYDMVKGPLEAVVNGVAKVVLAFADWLQGPVVSWVKQFKDEIMGFGAVLLAYAGYLAVIKIATGLWTAAQWLLNAALTANPIGLIVVGVAALVAGVIYAYKHFEGFRNVVNTVWEAIKGAFNAALPVIKAVWDGIAAGATWVWQNAIMPFFNWVSGTGWPLLKAAFTAGWSIIKTIFDTWKTAVMFIWNNVLVPAFQGIAAGWKILWFAIQVGWEAGKIVFEAVKSIVLDLWHNIFEPAWDAIAKVVSVAWSVIGVVFEGIKAGIQVIGEVIGWLWHNMFEPAWEGIKAGWQILMDYLKPIFDLFKSGMEGIGNVASKIADGIRQAWSGLVDVFKIPLHALGALLSGIPDNILGIEVPFVADLHSWGKSLQGLRSGGIVSGPGTGTSDSILGLDSNGVPTARVSNGEGVVPKRALSTPLGMAMFNTLLGMKRGGIAEGQIPWPPGDLGRKGEQPGNIPDRGAGSFPGVIGIPDWSNPGTVFGPPPEYWWQKPIDRNDILNPDFMPPGQKGPWLDRWGDKKRKIKMFAGGGVVGGGRSDGLNPGAGNLSDLIKRMFGVKDIGGRRSEDGYGEHSSGNAMDIMVGGDTAEGNAIAGFLKTNKDALGIDGMIWQQRSYGYGGGWDPKNKMEDRGSPTQNHMDHIHVILGKGRGAGAAAAPLPTGPLVDAQGMDVTGGSTAAGSSSSYRKSATEKQLREANDRVTDRQNQLAVSQQRLDEFEGKRASGEDVKQSTIDTATNQRDKFARELDEAKSDLETLKQGKLVEGGKSAGGSSGDNQFGDIGKMIFSGFLESFGLDGSVFTNLFDTPNVKSGMALANFGLGILGAKKDEASGAQGNGDLGFGNIGGGGGGGGLLDAGGALLAGVGDAAGVQFPSQETSPDAVAAGNGATGPLIVMNQPNLGVSPGALDDKSKEMTAAVKRNTTLPG